MLRPRQLFARELLEYIDLLTNAYLAPSTRATYHRAWLAFDDFCQELLGTTIDLPIVEVYISLFVAYLYKKGFSPSTISTYLSAIAYVHNMPSMPDPTKSFLIEKLLTGQRLVGKIDSRLPITIPILNKMVQMVPFLSISSYKQAMIKSMFLFAFSAFARVARVGELVTVPSVPNSHVLQWEDITFISKSGKISDVQVSFHNFKHNVKGETKVVLFSHGTACFFFRRREFS